ncbi:dynein intermediate chain, cytosolic [Fistulifera solaris]|uniref:Dynein intermediate chain, cytosolic n=1 Tax=Fistulifera solaris TaxID=1519565 RepID=A0A1Z5JI71_FISSO|nr:dynein intermediate chain, cytosolic [Fistulifera solaris]|eukprot:GAX13710.1 dynein intermediate chain, cytosolic [Fistulifera solaris]
MSESREQRQKALEERRKRIADLRETRNRRVVDTARVQASATANLDDYVADLLNEPAPVVVSVANSNDTANTAATTPTAINNESSPTETDAASSVPVTTTSTAPTTTSVALPKVETFELGTQTEEPELLPDEDEINNEERNENTTSNETDGMTPPQVDSDPATAIHSDTKDPKLLSDEQVQKEVSSKPFSDFLNTTSKKVERLLGTPLLSDLLVDHVGQVPSSLSSLQDGDAPKDERQFIASRQVYECHKWTSERDITDLDWSPLHRDCVLATYDRRGARPIGSAATTIAVAAIAPHDTPSDSLTPRSGELQSDGLALIWSLAMPQRPEHIFTCGSPVTTGRFHPTEAPLIVGGCESGQVVVWDVRAGRLPVQKSTFVVSGGSNKQQQVKGHSHPINSMVVLEGGAGFVTSSSDGKVNFWSLSNLREPAEGIQIGENVSCLALSPESGALVVGDDHGSMYTAGSSAASGGSTRRSQRQVKALECVDAEGTNLGHYGMVTALSMPKVKKGAHGLTGGPSKDGFLRGMGGLVLSSGVDWTVKLWAPAYRDTPLTSWVSHSYDYMSDVQWNPVHPSLFATGSSNGRLGLWNLALSLDEPLTGGDGIAVDPERTETASGLSGIHKLSWSLDGRRLAIASSDRMHVFHLTEEVLRSRYAEEDSKRVMQQFRTRGWIQDTASTGRSS